MKVLMRGGVGVLTGRHQVPGIPARLVQTTLPRLVLVPVVFRLAILVQALWTVGVGSSSALWFVAALHLVPNLAEIVWVFRWSSRNPASARLVPVIDTGYAVVLNLGAALVASPAQYAGITSITWTHLMGTVMVWTLLYGVLSGGLVIAGAAVLRYLMAAVSDTAPPMLGVFLTLVAALGTSLAIVVLLGASMRFALGFGEQQGRAAERERHRRDVHDTVLQVMESFAIPAPADEVDPAASLDQVRRTARAQAMRIRISLEHEPAASAGLHQRLRLLAAEMAAEGLRVEVVVQDEGGLDLPEPSVRALHDAAREALRNTLKHSGTRRAVVCLEETGDGVTVTVRDHGAGFDTGAHRPGFGIENSIIARLDEVGGRVRIDSSPGQGTRVSLTAPSVLRLPVG